LSELATAMEQRSTGRLIYETAETSYRTLSPKGQAGSNT
jgi:hypothetical protein